MKTYNAELITEAGSRVSYPIQAETMAKAITAAMRKIIFEGIRTISFTIYQVRG